VRRSREVAVWRAAVAGFVTAVGVSHRRKAAPGATIPTNAPKPARITNHSDRPMGTRRRATLSGNDPGVTSRGACSGWGVITPDGEVVVDRHGCIAPVDGHHTSPRIGWTPHTGTARYRRPGPKRLCHIWSGGIRPGRCGPRSARCALAHRGAQNFRDCTMCRPRRRAKRPMAAMALSPISWRRCSQVPRGQGETGTYWAKTAHHVTPPRGRQQSRRPLEVELAPGRGRTRRRRPHVVGGLRGIDVRC